MADLTLLTLPTELQLLIGSKLPSRELVKLSSTCKLFQKMVNDPVHDERLWKDKLPEYCLDVGLGLQFSRWRQNPPLVYQNQSCDASQGLNLGNTTITSYRQLSCEVDKNHQSLVDDAGKTDKSLAEHCLGVSDLKWNSGYTLHADIALACACSEAPSLSVYVRYVLLAFLECLSLERTALLIRKAADFIHENNVLGMIGDGRPAWLDFAARDPTEENTVATRQLATLVALLAHCFRLSQSSLQGVIEKEKRTQLQLHPLPEIFESLLSSETQTAVQLQRDLPPEDTPDTLAADGNADTCTDMHPPARSLSPADATQLSQDEASACADSPGPSDTATGIEGRQSPQVAVDDFSFTFLGANFSSDDFSRAVRLLGHIDRQQQLLQYVMEPCDSSLAVQIPTLVPLLRPGVADIVQQVMVEPRDFQKEFVACQMWQHVARENAGAAYEVMSPPYMCNRRSVWLATTSYMATYFLMRCKSRNEAILSHMEMPAEHSDNVLVGCLIELTMELYSLGFLLAACNMSLLALLQNEVSMRADIADMRYVLAGQFVDIHVTFLENNHVRAVVDTPKVLRDCVQWVLALFRLAAPPVFQLNSNFVQRLSKVLFCCMLRLPHVEQQRRCAKAALALCRLCLQRVALNQQPPVPELPLPQVDTRTLPQSVLGRRMAGQWGTGEPSAGLHEDRAGCSSGCTDGEATAADAASCGPPDGRSAVEAKDEREGDRGMRLLRKWLDDQDPEELDRYLEVQTLEGVLGSKVPETEAPSSKDTVRRRDPFWWGLFWFRKRRRSSPAPASADDSPVPTCPWLGELQYISGEIETEQCWADYEVELTAILGLQGGRDAIVALMPMGAQGEVGLGGAMDVPAHIISRLYECLAQVCSALGLFSMAALFYAHSVETVRHLPPNHVLEDQLDPLQPGTAPLTSARYIASTLNHLANELITSADYPAALRTLVFSRSVCTHELNSRRLRNHAPDGRAWSDGDTNEVYALLTCSTAQLAATVLELRIRYGLRTYRVSVPQWPPPPSAGKVATQETEIPSTFEYMHQLAWEAYKTARGRHVDSCLQALFVLGDIALVTYNLPEARRIFAVTGLVAADGAVQHYNLMSQCQSFSAIAGLSLGDAGMCRSIAVRCMMMYSFPQTDPLFRYTAAEDAVQSRFCAALDGTFGEPWELQRRGSMLPWLEVESESVTGRELEATASGGAGASAFAVAAGSSPGVAQADQGVAAANAAQVEREAVTAEGLQSQETDQILLRAMCEVHLQGREPQQFLHMLRMRAMHIHMDGCPPGEEEQRMQVFRQQIEEVGVPATFRAATIAACLELRQLPTPRTVSAWLLQHTGMQMQVHVHHALGQVPPPQVLPNEPALAPQLLQPLNLAVADAEMQPQPVLAPAEAHPPQNASIWELLSFAERPGVIPPEELLSSFMSASMPGVQLTDRGSSTCGANLLNEAAWMSIQHVSEHVALEHVDCEEVELTAISFFMHQVSLQVHSLYGNPSGAQFALSQLASRPNDEIGHVHIWYWGGAVAMHCGEWQRAMLLFRAAACSTQLYPHASMRAKAFVGMVEAVLAAAVSQLCPLLGAAQFLAEVQVRGDISDAQAVHVALCGQLGIAMQSTAECDSNGEEACRSLDFMKRHIQHALGDARAVGDQGVELRSLLLAQFILEVEGLATWDSHSGSMQWDETARPKWLCEEAAGLQAQHARLKELMHRLARNAFVTRKLLGCHVVVDPCGHVGMHSAIDEESAS